MISQYKFPWLNATRLAVALGCVLMLAVTGCDDDDDFDHSPPAGQGTMIVDNHTDDDISVFINGLAVQETKDDKWRAYDLDPGVYRIVLDQQGGDHSFHGDVDILEGRQTVLEVHFDLNDFNRYDVFIRFE